jgi:hypothetical protein
MFSVHGEMLQIFAAQRGQLGMFNDALVKQPCDILWHIGTSVINTYVLCWVGQ